jgi:hypothetical protein
METDPRGSEVRFDHQARFKRVEEIALSRAKTLEDVAASVFCLAGPESDCTTGQAPADRRWPLLKLRHVH